MPLYRSRAPVLNFDEGLSAIGKAFAPPTQQDLYLASKAATERANESRIAEAFNYAKNPNYDRSQAERYSFALGQSNGTNGYYAQDQNNATTLRTNAADNATRERTNALDNSTKISIAMSQPFTAKEGETLYLPKRTQEATGLPATVSGAFTLNPGQQTNLPDGRVLAGAEVPLTTDQLRARDIAQRPMDDPLRVALGFGNTPTATVQTPTGPQIVTAPQSLGRTPAPAAAAPSELSRLQAERDALPANDPRRAEYDGKISAMGRGATPDPYRDASDRALATRHDEIVKAGAAAGGMTGNLDRLETLLSEVPTGALAERRLQIAQYAQDVGLTDVASALTGGKLDEATAANAIVQRLAPGLRVPGTGAQSDRELQNFLASLPSLRNTPGGNRIIIDTLRGAAQRQQQAAEIARQSQSGKLDKFEAERQIAALSSPFARFSDGEPREGAASAPAAPAAAAASAPGSQQPVRVTTPAEARALPSGTPILLPDGSTGRVP